MMIGFDQVGRSKYCFRQAHRKPDKDRAEIPPPEYSRSGLRVFRHKGSGYLICANGVMGYRDTQRNPVEPDQVEVCKAFLRRCVANEKINKRSPSSYTLKHVCENWARRVGVGGYCSNGALITAALELGIIVWPYGEGPNAAIGVRRVDVEG